MIGGSFQISPAVTMWLSLGVGLIMLILGLNLLDVFQHEATRQTLRHLYPQII